MNLSVRPALPPNEISRLDVSALLMVSYACRMESPNLSVDGLSLSTVSSIAITSIRHC